MAEPEVTYGLSYVEPTKRRMLRFTVSTLAEDPPLSKRAMSHRDASADHQGGRAPPHPVS